MLLPSAFEITWLSLKQEQLVLMGFGPLLLLEQLPILDILDFLGFLL